MSRAERRARIEGAALDSNVALSSLGQMKVLFLDIDGVLNSRAYWSRVGDSITDAEFVTRSPRLLDPDAIARLNRLLRVTRADIVVASTWRLRETIQTMQQLIDAAGIIGRVIGLTPLPSDVPGWKCRGDEIAAWWTAHAVPNATMAILDDESDPGAFADRLVRTDPEIGLTEEDVERAIALLDSPGDPRK